MNLLPHDQLVALLEEHCGLSVATTSAIATERRLKPRLAALQMTSLAEYVELLRRQTPAAQRELNEAVELLTTHETYFFREWYQLDSFRERLLPTLMAANARSERLSIWSAGCSTGEEAYSIAMMLKSTPLLQGWKLRVVGTDISRQVIATARKARYGSSSFRVMQPEYERYFSGGAESEERTVSSDIRAICQFQVMNLLDNSTGSTFIGRVDAIFCRNVLIYLSPRARAKVVQRLHDSLYEGGYLLLGHSESLLRQEHPFETTSLTRDMIYRRAGER